MSKSACQPLWDADDNDPSSDNNDFLTDVLHGLSQQPKTLPCKYFYDKRGSELFEEICNQQEYYITRTELALLEEIKHELSDLIGSNARIIEPGSGAGEKVRLLLDALVEPACYIPIDISETILLDSEKVIKSFFPGLPVQPLVRDFSQPINFPELFDRFDAGKRVVFFPGSTIGNFTPGDAQAFIRRFADAVKPGGGLVIGVDLIKEAGVLERAYDDANGITAAFNKNLLVRINNELSANIDIDEFRHEARLNRTESRIEMHLVSVKEQCLKVQGEDFCFQENETIHTENSYKYTIESFQQLLQAAGFKPIQAWTDKAQKFSIHYCEAES